MSKIFNDYIVGAEREAAIEEAVFMNTMAKYDTMYEMVCMKYDQMVRDAELKVFSESGTYDDLAYFTEEAAKEVSGDKRSILQSIADALTAAWNKLISGIKNLFGKAQPEEEVEVDEGILTGINQLKEKSNNILSSINSGDIIKAGLGIAAAIGAGFAIKKTGVLKKIKGSEVNDDLNILQKLSEGLKTLSEKIMGVEAGKEDQAKEQTGIISKLRSGIATAIAALSSSIGKVGNNVADKKVSKAGEQPNGDVQQNSQNTNNQSTGEEAQGQTPDAMKTIGNRKYGVEADGKCYFITKAGNKQYLPDNQVPPALQNLVRKRKGKSAAAIKDAEDKKAADAAYQKKVADAQAETNRKANESLAKEYSIKGTTNEESEVYEPGKGGRPGKTKKVTKPVNHTLKISNYSGAITVDGKNKNPLTNSPWTIDDALNAAGIMKRGLRKQAKQALNSINIGRDEAQKVRDAHVTPEKPKGPINPNNEAGRYVKASADDVIYDVIDSFNESMNDFCFAYEDADSIIIECYDNDDIFEAVSELEENGYIISFEGSDIIIETPDNENYVESTAESIFGFDYMAEELAQESAQFEKELSELADLFNE